ncbi:ARF GTPase-activating protein GIT1,ARF GTPase-activating protein GIT2 [Mytilus edulis]|uniref:ARF GTPase-activating protein GIT1,ARF GTPase-activating protein GIT2 n=1 Tax=Mytilus edulis TaxID=6550 RepID=A0A8S3TU56_MYTED|nr:ARF GTPase-activating protein GIT1,ARF GTPase-activating protein GIT2 [Mytilus edulis]
MSRVKGRTATEVCADCSAPDPTWASINRGVLICDECCSVHRSLGRHISQIKSLNKGQWSPTLLSMVQHLANHGANSIWEHSLLDPSQSKHGKKKPGPRDQVQVNMGKRNQVTQGPSTVSINPSHSKPGKKETRPQGPSTSKQGKRKTRDQVKEQSKHGKNQGPSTVSIWTLHRVNMGKRNQGPSTESMHPAQSKQGKAETRPQD